MANNIIDITYGTGEVEGYTDYDTVSIGSPALVVQNQGFGEMYLVSSDFVSASCDGLYVCTEPLLKLAAVMTDSASASLT